MACLRGGARGHSLARVPSAVSRRRTPAAGYAADEAGRVNGIHGDSVGWLLEAQVRRGRLQNC